MSFKLNLKSFIVDFKILNQFNLTYEIYEEIVDYYTKLNVSNGEKMYYIKQLYNCMEKSPSLIKKLNDRSIKIEELNNMSIVEICPEFFKEFSDSQKNIENIKNEVVTTSLYICPKCNSQCYYREEQKRSADEGMSVKVTCGNKNCGNWWWIF